MTSAQQSTSQWGASYRLVAAEKWKAQSASMGRAATDALVEYARPQAGMQVLDLAAGTGEPGITLAQRVRPAGHVTALDLSQELLDIAAQRAGQRGLTNFSTQQADAHSLPFPDNSFDLVLSNIAIHNVKGKVARDKVIEEAVRVLRPGGRLLIADMRGTSQYRDRLVQLGMTDVMRKNLGWRLWWSGPWLPTRLVTATKPPMGPITTRAALIATS